MTDEQTVPPPQRCFALPSGHCSHINCPRPRDPLRFCPWVLNGHITGQVPVHQADDRPVNP